MKKPLLTLIAATAIGTASLLQPAVPQVNAASLSQVSQTELAEAGALRPALEKLIEAGVIAGYEDGTIKPNRPMTRAEFAKVATSAFGLQPKADGQPLPADVSADEWYAPYVRAMLDSGWTLGANGKFQPTTPITQEEIVANIGRLINKKPSIVQLWTESYNANKPVTRAEAARWVSDALPHIPSPSAEVTGVKALNAITLEVTFSAPLTAADVSLDQAKKNFAFDNGMALLNVPQLKTGARATYIVPVTVQKPGATYTLTYKGKTAGTFEASDYKLKVATVAQVTNDTFELESFRTDGTVDYGYVVEAYYGSRGGQELVLGDGYDVGGTTYDILSSMRDKSVTITPEGGQPIVAKYVPFTQATDGRQAPKFRLPAGESLKPGVTYTVTSDWSTIRDNGFTAREIAPLAIQSASAASETAVAVTLTQDPKDELFAGRSVTLTAADGTTLTATYRFTSRKGATGTFDLANGVKLAPKTTYKLAPAGGWATADNVTVTTN